jgi:hypothetical protein
MPADYKYGHISLSRLKALSKTAAQAFDLYQDLAKTNVLAPSVIERMRVLSLLAGHAAGHAMDRADHKLVEEILKEMGEEPEKW